MSRRSLIAVGALLVAVCAAVILIFGRTYTFHVKSNFLNDPIPESADVISVEPEGGENVVELIDKSIGDDEIILKFRSKNTGRAFMYVAFSGVEQYCFHMYTHPLGVITAQNYFGDCSGDIVVPICFILYLALLFYVFLKRYRADTKKSLYRYRNVMDMGMLVFLGFLIVNMIPRLFDNCGLLDIVNQSLNSVRVFSSYVLPIAFFVFALVAVSNISLMRREGKNWRNMLGIILGVTICLLTLTPYMLEYYLQWSTSTVIDVHNERGAWLYIELFTEGVLSALAVYLECILLGTVVCAVKAARHVPPYDRDYVIIHGCQIMSDGTLTPLLRSRVDRALEFAEAQKEKAGKDTVFVPSGGQGTDETIPEAHAIKNYLVSRGVPEERILVEDKSESTSENLSFAMKLIREHSKEQNPKVAFSTTNYHVFRAGMLADSMGEKIEGMGSPTKRYFWINAFIREFIATLVSERKKHVFVIASVTAIILAAVIIRYLSVVL